MLEERTLNCPNCSNPYYPNFKAEGIVNISKMPPCPKCKKELKLVSKIIYELEVK